MHRSSRPGEITDLLRAQQAGDQHAEEKLWAQVYDELRQLAHWMRHERGLHARAGAGTLSIVHEAYLRLIGTAEIDWKDRRYFFAVAARAMRFVLIDRARRRLAKKRAVEIVGEIPVELVDPQAQAPEDLLAVHRALDKLARVNPRHEKLVELHYFAGLTFDEVAEVLQISRSTAVRDWKAVRIWLHGELEAVTAAP